MVLTDPHDVPGAIGFYRLNCFVDP